MTRSSGSGSECGSAPSSPAEAGVIDFLGRRAQRDKHGGLRALLFISLGQIGGGRVARHILDEMVNTREQTMRGFTALALGISGAKEAGEPLLSIYRDRKRASSERAAALSALGRIADPDPISLPARLAFGLNPYVVSDAVEVVTTIP